MADLVISYDKVQNASTQIGLIRADIEHALKSASRAVDGLIGDGFSTATASAEYGSSFADFVSETEAALLAVSQIELFFRNIVDTFTEADADLAKPLGN